MNQSKDQSRNAYAKELYGYHGKILNINLTDQSIQVEAPSPLYWRTYGGGGLLAAEQLLRKTNAGVDPLGPDNLLIFASSVMASQPYVGLASMAVCAKSPLTNGMGETHVEGPFSANFKQSGFDAIVINGKSKSPVIIEIDNGKVKFVAAHPIGVKMLTRWLIN
jgi:aldehyde:ferredoxin oxidoreductase